MAASVLVGTVYGQFAPGISFRHVAVESQATPVTELVPTIDYGDVFLDFEANSFGLVRRYPQVSDAGEVLFDNAWAWGGFNSDTYNSFRWAHIEREPGQLDALVRPFTMPAGSTDVWRNAETSMAPDGTFVVSEESGDIGAAPLLDLGGGLQPLDLGAFELGPNGDIHMERYYTVRAGNGGTVGVFGFFQITPDERVEGYVWWRDGQAVLVAHEGLPMPNGVDTFGAFPGTGATSAASGGPIVAPDGVYFEAAPRDLDGAVDFDRTSLLFGGPSGTIEILTEGAPAPEFQDMTVARWAVSHDTSGVLVVRASLIPSGATLDEAMTVLYRVEAGVPAVLLVLDGPAPGMNGFEFARGFDERSASALKAGRVALVARVRGADGPLSEGIDDVLYLLEDGELRLVQREGAVVPDRLNRFYRFNSFRAPMLNNRGDFVLRIGTSTSLGGPITGADRYLMYDRSGDTLRTLISWDDEIEVSTVAGTDTWPIEEMFAEEALANGAVGFSDDRTLALLLRLQTTLDFPGLFLSRVTTVSAITVGGCNSADFAEPYFVLDLADLDAFIGGFGAGDASADLAEPFGIVDLADVNAFITAYLAGCP
ncbi:MAG: GC-type dockerin domain-anchored protein [Planctomycetota bacterium]